jgi:hypothetical protein
MVREQLVRHGLDKSRGGLSGSENRNDRKALFAAIAIALAERRLGNTLVVYFDAVLFTWLNYAVNAKGGCSTSSGS